MSQLAEWRDWFDTSANRQVFVDSYGIAEECRLKRFRPCYVLIFGTRSEFEARPHLNSRRSQMARHDEVLMTFDRIEPQYQAQDLLCSHKAPHAYEALTVPATYRLGPLLAESHSKIVLRDEAVERNEWLSDERKQFLA